MRRLFIFILIFITTGAAMASNADSALVEHISLEKLTVQESLHNPALHGIGYQRSFSQLALGIDLQHQSTAFIPEKGKGFTLPYIKVNTYHHLNGSSTVWGEASYTTGKQHDIKWNSTSDYDLLQPYILADTAGGDTRRERYTISGGYAARINRLTLGGEMLVRAEQEYRGRDPRMRGIVTDLTLRIGSGYDFMRYRVGASIEANGMTLLLHASPIDHSGIYCDLSLDEHRYHRKLAEFNSMPLTDLYNEHAGVTVGWKRDKDYRLATLAHLDYTRRTGNEHVGGTSDARYFPVIACLTMYKGQMLDSYLGALYGRNHWNIVLTAGYKSQSEEYIYPHREMKASHAYGKLQGQCFLRPGNKILLTVDAHASYLAKVSDKLLMPFANMGEDITRLIQHKHKFATANYTDLGAKVRADYAWRQTRYGIFAELGGGLTLCSASEHQTLFHSSIGITF